MRGEHSKRQHDPTHLQQSRTRRTAWEFGALALVVLALMGFVAHSGETSRARRTAHKVSYSVVEGFYAQDRPVGGHLESAVRTDSSVSAGARPRGAFLIIYVGHA